MTNIGKRETTAAVPTSCGDWANLAIEVAELGTWRWHVNQDRIAGSDRCRRLLNLPVPERGDLMWSVTDVLDAIQHDFRARICMGAKACLDGTLPFEVEFCVSGQDGGPRWLRARGRSGHFGEEPAVTLYGVVADIGEERRAVAERLDLLRRLSGAQEDVRRRIAHDLHDQVGQTVTGLSLGLKGLEHAIARLEEVGMRSEPSLLERVRWLQGLTGEIGRDIHQASADLRPAALDDLGLPRALTALIEDWSGRYGIVADVQILGNAEPRMSAEIETVLYRVIQEALTNVLKHAQARNVSLVFDGRQKEVRAVIEDDGTGFDVDEYGRDRPPPYGRRSLGLSGMRERLATVGGTLRIESSTAGTTLFVTVALDAAGLSRDPQ